MLLANGHPLAWIYPLPRVADEAELIRRRDNIRIATEAVALHAAAGAVVAGDNSNFDALVQRLMEN